VTYKDTKVDIVELKGNEDEISVNDQKFQHVVKVACREEALCGRFRGICGGNFLE
jgi:hypothetical protein